MEAYKQFLTLTGDTDGALMRGVNLGDSVDTVLLQEGKPTQHRSGPVPFYTFSRLLVNDFWYSLTYFYDSARKVKNITLILEYHTEQVSDYTLEEFTALTHEVDQFLREKYGEPTARKEQRRKNDRDLYLFWVDRFRSDAPVNVAQMYYSDVKDGLIKAMKLEFQKHYDD